METIRILALHLAFGGVEKAVSNMANLFVENYNVEIICMYDMPNAPAYMLDSRIKIRYLLDEVPNKKEFKEAIRNKNVLRIFSEGMKSISILYKKKYKLIKTIKEIHDGILISTRNEDSVLVSKYRNKGVYTIAQLHHDHKFLKKYVNDFRNKYNGIDVFALLNQQMCDEVNEIMKNCQHTKCVVIPNFIDDVNEFKHNETSGKSVLSVGRLHPEKGYCRMIEDLSPLLKKHTDWELNIIGDGEEKEKLANKINDLGMINQIHLLGRKNSEEIQKEMRKANCYAMTSYSEGFGIVLIEAMSCSLPCVAYDVRLGPKSIISDGVTGFLIKDGDAENFRDRIEEILVDNELAERMGGYAYQNSKKYMRSNVKEQWYKILQIK